MDEKSTYELEKTLENVHVRDFKKYYEVNKGNMIENDKAFSEYVKPLFKTKKISQQTIFLKADIPERYGYKLISGEKRTRQRDIILRICYAAGLTLEETQKALRIYGMPELYSKIPRDALLMLVFNERPGDILDVNELLKKNGMEVLRSCGVQE
ncbi:hypothetical protein SAMN02910289_01316 [Lachnospiraceae bacterium RM5]|nr:hypothetical protein SAMN02910289_01316 [Lachnospiraceae bacterium RM5]